MEKGGFDAWPAEEANDGGGAVDACVGLDGSGAEGAVTCGEGVLELETDHLPALDGADAIGGVSAWVSTGGGFFSVLEG